MLISKLIPNLPKRSKIKKTKTKRNLWSSCPGEAAPTETLLWAWAAWPRVRLQQRRWGFYLERWNIKIFFPNIFCKGEISTYFSLFFSTLRQDQATSRPLDLPQAALAMKIRIANISHCFANWSKWCWIIKCAPMRDGQMLFCGFCFLESCMDEYVP